MKNIYLLLVFSYSLCVQNRDDLPSIYYCLLSDVTTSHALFSDCIPHSLSDPILHIAEPTAALPLL